MTDLRTQAAQHEAADKARRENLRQRLAGQQDTLIEAMRQGYIGSVPMPEFRKVSIYYDSPESAKAAHAAFVQAMDPRREA